MKKYKGFTNLEMIALYSGICRSWDNAIVEWVNEDSDGIEDRLTVIALDMVEITEEMKRRNLPLLVERTAQEVWLQVRK